MDGLRKAFTENAEQFDSLMVKMLAENESLSQKVTQMIDERDALRERVELIESFIRRVSTQHSGISSGLRDYHSYYYKLAAEAKEVLGE